MAQRDVDVGECAFDSLYLSELQDRILAASSSANGGMLVTANLDHLLRYHRDPNYRILVDRADLVVADGMPIVWASRLQGTPLPERVAGSTLTVTLAERLAEEGRSLFLLGGNTGVAAKAAEELQRRSPSLRIAGTHCPPLGFEKDPAEMDTIRGLLRDSRPDVVYVALGSPKQEILADQLRQEFPNIWWLGVGISLSFIAGEVGRAPLWLQRIGLEWLHRLAQEPRRLGKRYLVDGVPFGIWLMLHSLRMRFRGPSAENR